MPKLSAIVSIIMIMSPLSAMAYTQDDADACTPDALRLCQQAIPDPDRVTQCLVQNKQNLSPGCKNVFTRPVSAARERPEKIQETKY